MDFKEVTDALFSGVTHQELAEILGVSVPSIRQARLNKTAKAHRKPPEGWEIGVIRLSMQKAQFYSDLAEKIERDLERG